MSERRATPRWAWSAALTTIILFIVGIWLLNLGLPTSAVILGVVGLVIMLVTHLVLVSRGQW